jgi:cyanate permease
MSISGMVFRVGIVVSTLLGGYIYAINKGLPYIMVGCFTLLSYFLVFFMVEPKIDSEKFTLTNYLKQTRLGVMELFKNNKTKYFSLYYFLIGGVGWYFIYYLDQVYAADAGFNEIERGWLFSIVFLVIGIINITISRFVETKKKLLLILLPVIMAIGFIPAMWANKGLAIISILLVEMIATLRFSVLDQYANDSFESKYRATALSALNMVVSLIYAVISVLSFKLIDGYGSKPVMTILGVVVILVGYPLTKKLIGAENESRN